MQILWTRPTFNGIGAMHHGNDILYLDCMIIKCVADVGVDVGEDFGIRQGEGVCYKYNCTCTCT